jgi:hypothetical protein
MKKLLSHFQWLAALLASALLFWLSADPIRWLDPTAGAFDAGVLQVPILAAAWWFGAIGVMWLGLQLCFPSLDDWIDSGDWREAWNAASSYADRRFGLLYCAGVLVALLTSYLVCLVAVALAL